MAETFTRIDSEPTNGIEMNEQETVDNIGVDDITFYSSITADLDKLVLHPKYDTVQNILNHSQNYVSA